MIIKQGTVLPTTGIGTGYLLVFIYVLVGWSVGFEEMIKVPTAYLLLFIPALMQFSYKDFIVEDETGNCYYRYRILFLFRFKVKVDFQKYRSIVIRTMKKTYNVMQGAAPGLTIGEGKYSEEYVALVGYISPSEKEEICKGKRHELDLIIKTHIEPKGIRVYLGAPKKGYEYHVE